MKIHRIGVILGIACCTTVGAALAAQQSSLCRPLLQDMLAIALAALVPMLLAGLALLREMAPLAALQRPLQVFAGGSTSVSSGSNAGNPRQLARELLDALERANARVRELEQARLASVAESRLLEYGSSKMQAVLQCLPDGVLVLDPGGEVTFASGKVDPLLGVAASQVLAQPPEVWCEDASLRAMLASVRNGSPDARRRSTVEFTPQRVPDKHLCATIQPLQGGEAGLAFGTLVVLRDATREHLARQASNDFVAHVSHELKSPLNVIGMYTEQLSEPTTEDAQRVEAVNTIQDEVERMVTLVNNLLNVSKIETGAMRPDRSRVRLDDLLRDCFHLAQSRAQARSVSLDMQIPRELAPAAMDKDLFRIALNNLVNNAIKYNHSGGNVTIAAEQGEREVVISVRDNGIGMAPDEQARVTEKFYRVAETGAEQRGGHGLGLYLTKQIVELHHGRLAIESELGAGSTFSIHLPSMPALQEANVL